MRVLLLTTPLGDGPANGASLAAVDLAQALARAGLAEPVMLASASTRAPEGCELLRVHTRGGRSVEALAAIARARADVVHAMFAPRASTGLALAVVALATSTPLVQTVASRPRAWAHLGLSLPGAAIVATSSASERALIDGGVPARRLSNIPLPFAPPRAVEAPPEGPVARRLLFAGDYEFGDALEPTLEAFATLSVPRGMSVELVVAARAKTRRARAIERALRARLARGASPGRRVWLLGEVPSLLPWILSAAAVVLPARDTFAKLDHPRVLLEALSLGVPIVVGPAPPLAELVHEGGDGDEGVGEVAVDVPALREALERALVRATPAKERVAAVLARRRPDIVAEAYAALYRRVASAGA